MLWFFLQERLLVEWVISADVMNLVVTCTADCTCHHLTKNIIFLSEIWNLKQIKDLANRKCCSICLFERCFFFLSKKYHYTWLYVTLTGHITIRNILGKMNAWGTNQSVYYSYSMMLLLNYCFQPDVTVFLLERILVERVNSEVLMNLVVTCTVDCKCHHLTKNVYFLSEIWNSKQIKDLEIRKCCSICLFKRYCFFLRKKYHYLVKTWWIKFEAWGANKRVWY